MEPLIYDRTLQEVLDAKNKVVIFYPCTDGTYPIACGFYPVYNRSSRAYLNVEDINRIEEWTQYLCDLLNQYGYHVSCKKRTWTEEGIPPISEMNRIRSNIDALQNAFHSIPEWREIIYDSYLDYERVNVLEWDLDRIRLWLDSMIEGMKIKQSNTNFVVAGGVFNS